jgi:hypothetical protein
VSDIHACRNDRKGKHRKKVEIKFTWGQGKERGEMKIKEKRREEICFTDSK